MAGAGVTYSCSVPKLMELYGCIEHRVLDCWTGDTQKILHGHSTGFQIAVRIIESTAKKTPHLFLIWVVVIAKVVICSENKSNVTLTYLASNQAACVATAAR